MDWEQKMTNKTVELIAGLPVSKNARLNMTDEHQIIELLRQTRKPLTRQEIAEHLGNDWDLSRVSNALDKRRYDSTIERVPQIER